MSKSRAQVCCSLLFFSLCFLFGWCAFFVLRVIGYVCCSCFLLFHFVAAVGLSLSPSLCVSRSSTGNMSNLANAKSTYSSKTRIGNWSEDQFGKELASQPRPEVKHTTIAQEDFPRHPTSVYQNRTMPTGTRDSGATFADMFGHRGAASGKDHFQTSDPINGGQRRSGAARKRAKQLNAEKSVSG